MRVLAFVVALAMGTPALAAGPAQSAAPVAAPAPTAAQVEDLRERLLGAQQTIATLERRLSDEQNRAVALDTCRVKNGQLVMIARELIEGYGRRYRLTHNDPIQPGRRRFEFELQTLSQSVYADSADAVVKPAAAADGASAHAAAVPPAPVVPADILPPPPDRRPARPAPPTGSADKPAPQEGQ